MNYRFLLLLFFLNFRAELKIGDVVKDFSLPDETGVLHQLSEFRGSRVALVFYPKDGSPYCKKQIESLKEAFIDLGKKGIVVLGINNDTMESHARFKRDFQIPFSLLTATKAEIDYFGVAGWFGKAERKTFLINENGVLVHIIDDVKLQHHHQQILDGFSIKS